MHLPLYLTRGLGCRCIRVLHIIATLVEVIHRADLSPAQIAARNALTILKLDDWRLGKLNALVFHEYAGLALRGISPDEEFYCGHYSRAAELAIEQAGRCPLDIDSLAVAAEAFAVTDTAPTSAGLSGPQTEILNLLTALAVRRESVAKAASDVVKLVQNFRSVRALGAVLGYRALFWLDQPQTGASEGTLVFYSSPHLNPRHWKVLTDPDARAMLQCCSNIAPASITVRAAELQLDNQQVLLDQLAPEVLCELSVTGALYHGDVGRALDFANCLGNYERRIWRRLAVRIELYCLLAMGRCDDAIRRASLYCSHDQSYCYVVPAKALLGGKRWRELRHLAGEIGLPNLLDVYWHNVDEAEHETTRRIAYDEFLKVHQCRRPSELGALESGFDRQELVYFLANVCVPEVMDVSFDVFPGSRVIEEERINICGLLAELDPDHSDEYRAELKARAKYQGIQDGLRDIDRSRVHVNVDAVARWAEKELKESFSRYQDLLKSKVGFGTSDDFEVAYQKFIDEYRAAAPETLRYPEQEGDSLLIETLEAIKGEYLNNPDYGLDAHLSMRVRHGSLSGHLRSSLEERSLITTKKESGDGYSDNTSLADRLVLSADERKHLFNCFSAFSAKYDGIIEELTKNRLQIRSTLKPFGMFALTLEHDPLVIHYVRSRLQEGTSFEEFLFTVFAALSVQLQHVALRVRDHILSEVKQSVEAAFETLRASLEHGMAPWAYVQINSWIADVIPEVQAAIDRVAEWFVPFQQRHEVAVRTVEQIVDIGIEFTHRAHRGFSPVIERDVEDIAVHSTALLSEFTDIIFTVLDNVYCHCGSKTPWVRMRVWTAGGEADCRMIMIRVESEVALGACIQAAQSKLERIKDLMLSGEYRKHVNLEGGTGLLKLKRLVSPDTRQELDFGFIGETYFFVEIGLIRPPSAALPPGGTS